MRPLLAVLPVPPLLLSLWLSGVRDIAAQLPLWAGGLLLGVASLLCCGVPLWWAARRQARAVTLMLWPSAIVVIWEGAGYRRRQRRYELPCEVTRWPGCMLLPDGVLCRDQMPPAVWRRLNMLVR